MCMCMYGVLIQVTRMVRPDAEGFRGSGSSATRIPVLYVHSNPSDPRFPYTDEISSALQSELRARNRITFSKNSQATWH